MHQIQQLLQDVKIRKRKKIQVKNENDTLEMKKCKTPGTVRFKSTYTF